MEPWQLQQLNSIQMAAAMQFAQQQQQIAFYQQQQLNISLLEDEEESDEDDESKRTLFCANLDERVTEELLYEVFIQAGPIESVRIPKDNGKSRCYGFVAFVHAISAPYAMQLMQGLELFRKTVTIKYQGKTQIPQRRNLPADCVYMSPRQMNNSKRNSYDNSALRGPNNPFRSSNSPDWTKGSSGGGKERVAHSRGNHRNDKPYQRHSGGDTHRRSGGSGHDRHHGNNRRSEQRNGNRR